MPDPEPVEPAGHDERSHQCTAEERADILKFLRVRMDEAAKLYEDGTIDALIIVPIGRTMRPRPIVAGYSDSSDMVGALHFASLTLFLDGLQEDAMGDRVRAAFASAMDRIARKGRPA